VKKVAWVFPGQGSQLVGMGRDLYDGSKAAREVFEIADATLEVPITRLCFEGPVEELTATQNAQPAILTVSTAILAALGVISVASLGVAWRLRAQQAQVADAAPVSEPVVEPVVEPALEQGSAERQSILAPLFVAGHSLGEYSALLASGALNFVTALRLVRKRGELMADADEGTMAAVIGMDPGQLEQVVAETAAGEELVIANYNAPGQLVISGAAAAVTRAGELARRLGAKRVLPLNVSAAFHSALMAPAASQLSPAIEAAEMATAVVPVVANVDGRPVRQVGAIRGELRTQITAPVRWIDTVRYMAGQGVDTFVEIGPGNVLTGLIKRIAPGSRLINLQNLESIEAEP
jgi:[acyl-carrier-protein] S-malonyltransferase